MAPCAHAVFKRGHGARQKHIFSADEGLRLQRFTRLKPARLMTAMYIHEQEPDFRHCPASANTRTLRLLGSGTTFKTLILPCRCLTGKRVSPSFVGLRRVLPGLGASRAAVSALLGASDSTLFVSLSSSARPRESACADPPHDFAHWGIYVQTDAVGQKRAGPFPPPQHPNTGIPNPPRRLRFKPPPSLSLSLPLSPSLSRHGGRSNPPGFKPTR